MTETVDRAARTERVSVSNGLGELHGTLTLPGGARRSYPAVLVVPGSGPTDRDGNSSAGVHSDAYAQLASALQAREIASLRYDKAGVGESASAFPASESELLFEMGAHDVALWMEAMRADARLTRITVVGHSEGALLAVLAHAEAPADGIVSLEGAGRPIGDILREQLEPQLSGAELRDEAFDIIAALEQGETVDDVPRSLLSLFRPSIQPYLISWMQYDPAEELGRVDVPVLIVHGTTDLQVPLSDARRLASANPEAMLEELAGMNHVLKLDDGATIDEQAMRSYADPSWPLAQELVDALVAFAGR